MNQTVFALKTYLVGIQSNSCDLFSNKHLNDLVPALFQITSSVLYRIKGDHLRSYLLGDNSSIRVLALGGEKFPSCDWLKKYRSANNKTRFINLYGTTEVSCWAIYYLVTEEDIR